MRYVQKTSKNCPKGSPIWVKPRCEQKHMMSKLCKNSAGNTSKVSGALL